MKNLFQLLFIAVLTLGLFACTSDAPVEEVNQEQSDIHVIKSFDELMAIISVDYPKPDKLIAFAQTKSNCDVVCSTWWWNICVDDNGVMMFVQTNMRRARDFQLTYTFDDIEEMTEACETLGGTYN